MLRSRLHAATLSFQQIKKLDLAQRLQDETLLKSIAGKLGVPPPLNSPKIVWSWCWKIQCFFLPLLHAWDKYVPQDTCLNLAVLWWKAIAGDQVAFNLLPSFTRSMVRWPFRLFFPRLHHQNVALRTKFLDKALREEIEIAHIDSGRERVAVLSLGAGFDTRSIRFLNGEAAGREGIDFFEMDLPEVIAQKRGLLERYSKRRPSHVLPNLIEANLNDSQGVDKALAASVFKDEDEEGKPATPGSVRYKKIVILVEAVLMYVEKDKVAPTLKMVVNAAKSHSGSVSFVFSDRFPGVYEQLDKLVASTNDVDIAEKERALVQDYLLGVDNRLNVVEWLPKPGRARHQGVSRVISRRDSMMNETFPRLSGYGLL